MFANDFVRLADSRFLRLDYKGAAFQARAIVLLVRSRVLCTGVLIVVQRLFLSLDLLPTGKHLCSRSTTSFFCNFKTPTVAVYRVLVRNNKRNALVLSKECLINTGKNKTLRRTSIETYLSLSFPLHDEPPKFLLQRINKF